MRMKGILTVVLLMCVVAAGTGCPPRVAPLRCIFNQGTYGTYAFYSESEWSDFFHAEQQAGDDFTLTEGNSTVTHVSWHGAYRDNAPVTDDFTLTVFRDDGAGMPETGGYWEHRTYEHVDRTATSGRVEPGVADLTIYEYSCDVTGWDFAPGTTYYISIVNDTGKWVWCEEGGSGGNGFCVFRESWGDDWHGDALDFAFRLWSNE